MKCIYNSHFTIQSKFHYGSGYIEKILEMAVKHGVNKDEIEQCFANRTGPYLEDTRADHLTDPITLWFIAETNFGRLLKLSLLIKY